MALIKGYGTNEIYEVPCFKLHITPKWVSNI